MGTFFEAFLAGEDRAHLEAVTVALWDEVKRIERMLSRFDPASEIYRVNQLAATQPVKVSRELLAVLSDCLRWHRETDGYFDVTLGSGGNPPYILNAARSEVSFSNSPAAIDLGAYGKGYALDRLSALLCEQGITSALVNAGSSSIIAIGYSPLGGPWAVDLANPNCRRERMRTIMLSDQAFSCSATFARDRTVSDIIVPSTHQPLETQALCYALAESAAEAEVLSTACLAMGEECARGWLQRHTRSIEVHFANEIIHERFTASSLAS
jgi:thiamine biosynthesis lipoprotein